MHPAPEIVAVCARIEAIIGRYNPTLSEAEGGAKGNTKETAAYFRNLFCWPTAVVERPEFGLVCPAYPANFFFDKNASRQIDLRPGTIVSMKRIPPPTSMLA